MSFLLHTSVSGSSRRLMRPVALRKQSRAFLHNHDVPLAPIATLGLEHLGVETYDHSVVAAVQTRFRVGDMLFLDNDEIPDR